MELGKMLDRKNSNKRQRGQLHKVNQKVYKHPLAEEFEMRMDNTN